MAVTLHCPPSIHGTGLRCHGLGTTAPSKAIASDRFSNQPQRLSSGSLAWKTWDTAWCLINEFYNVMAPEASGTGAMTDIVWAAPGSS
ncbi:hypothetical protein [Leptolyngbya sp. CCY15150]|uniref:hypothetical protein n=1 Tax=Leptolyngbya sp. CCY15150 TaxID=2767772 RepID=UPI00194EE64B|nr:hypothetical protein [Leptolyngbya sp. CCY15150]